VLIAQALGSLIVTTCTFAVSMAVMLLVNATGLLRVSEEGELYGLDLHEHGIPAYPEYVISSLATAASASAQSASVEHHASAAAKVMARTAVNEVGS
jgi:ammonium transporter, Amt family